MRWTLSVFSCHTLSLLAVCLQRPAPGARSPGRNLSVASRGQISPTPKNPDGGFRLVLRQSGVVQGEIWKGWGGVILFSPVSLQQLLAECFPVCLSIIRASSGRPLSHYALHLWSKCLLEMSHHKGWWERRCYYQSAIHSRPDRHQSITFKKSFPERERPFFLSLSLSSRLSRRREENYARFMRTLRGKSV